MRSQDTFADTVVSHWFVGTQLQNITYNQTYACMRFLEYEASHMIGLLEQHTPDGKKRYTRQECESCHSPACHFWPTFAR
jgi:hypothetical protein